MNPPVVLSVRIRGDAEGPQTGDVVLEGSAVSEYTPAKEYEKGDVFIYEEQFYQALEDFTAGNEPDMSIIKQIGIPDIILENFKTNTKYKKYEFITYEGQLYRAKNDFTSGNAWQASKWEKLGESVYTFRSTDGSVNITTSSDGHTITLSVIPALNNLRNDIDTQLNNKVDKVSGKGLSSLDYVQEDKDKLTGLVNIKMIGANLTYNPSSGELSANDPDTPVYDSALDSTSTNAVQNKVITQALYEADSALQSVKTRVTTNENNITSLQHDMDAAEDDIDALGLRTTALEETMDNKVDKVPGKGLSTNDFDNSWVSALQMYKDKELKATFNASTQTVTLSWENKS